MMLRALQVLVLILALLPAGCRGGAAKKKQLDEQTFAELRTVKGAVEVTPPGKEARHPYPRERLLENEQVVVPSGGLAWMRRDGGAVWLIAGPATLTVHAQSVEVAEGRVFVDSESGEPVTVVTPRGEVELSDARASLEVGKDQVTVYVLRGSARAADGARTTAGQRLTLLGDGKASREPVVSWEDWTGGLGTADAAANPAPYGIGTVGARKPGEQGKPRFSLVIQRLDVRVTIDQDFATTEVDQTFVNPSSDTVEGLFSFRTPLGAVLQRFGVDRDGDLVWGRVKESAAAVRQYESNVYAGSQEDPALLQWAGAGTYQARLYPIHAGEKRRVVTRYTEWLARQGRYGERRMYVYPMAAQGARASLPRIEELTVSLDLSKADAKVVRSGMGGTRVGKQIVVKAFDFVPQADLAVELFDDGQTSLLGYRAPHRLTPQDAPEGSDPEFAREVSNAEVDYVAIPVRAPPADNVPTGVDLAIVVDTSAATEPSALALSRSIASSLLAHLGPEDRAALWTGDASLRPVAEGSGALGVVDAERRKSWLAGLAAIERGGATDIGALLTEAASRLDPNRRGAVVYVGDGAPSVGELAPEALQKRLARLPKTTRVLVAAVGSQPNLVLLESLCRGAPAEQVYDAYGAASAALRLLEAAGRPMWLGAEVDLGPTVQRILPRTLPPLSADETVIVVGRLSGQQPTKLVLTGSGGRTEQRLRIRPLQDSGDLRRRWGEARLAELMASGAGRASLVDIGRRFGLVSPFTSLYVATKREAEAEENDVAQQWLDRRRRRERWKPWATRHYALFDFFSRSEPAAAVMARIEAEEEAEERETEQIAEENADNREGGTGTRAKGEEGSMGNPNFRATNRRYAIKGPSDNEAPMAAKPSAPSGGGMARSASEPERLEAAMAAALSGDKANAEAAEFGAIGALKSGAAGDPNAPTAPWGRDTPLGTDEASAPGMAWGDEIGDASSTGGLGLSGIGASGGGQGAGTGTGQGFGSGHGRLGGAHKTSAPTIRMGATQVSGRLPPEVIQRIVRQNYGRFRMCYEQGLARNPNLAGRVSVRFVIGRDGGVTNVANAGSDIPDAAVVQCVVAAYLGLSFPQPEAGIVRVVHPVMFGSGGGSSAKSEPPEARPEEQPAAQAKPRLAISTSIGVIGHVRRPCGPAADLPLSDRLVLWRERLASVAGAGPALAQYRYALEQCEASDWRERAALLVQIVGRLPSVRDRVELWRALLAVSPTAADAVYRFTLLRVQTSQDLKDLHDALGLERIDPQLLEVLLKKAQSPAERLAALRGAAEKFSDDTELALRVLDAYEDAGDDAGGRAWARKLRRRVDATAHLRTSVGEYYLRLAVRGGGDQAKRDSDEAQRAFGEIVEFAPEDPLARRRLGDLLRAHGWYADALRQYQTLAELTPDDASVPLLLAAAAQGTGKTEEAVRWLEKAAATGAPDGSSSVALAARALASAYLAWARQDSTRAGKPDEAKRLRERAARLAAGESGQGVRVILSWSHPELRPQLWTNALGSIMPAPDNLPLLGVAQAYVPSSPIPVLEVRLDPEDAARAARLDAKATLTVIVAEGEDNERILTQQVGFRGEDREPLERVTLRFEDGVLQAGAL